MKRIILALCVLLIVPAGVYAYDWAAKGFTVESETAKGEKVTIVLKDGAGKGFTVTGAADMDEAVAGRILAARKVMDAWQNIKIERAAFEQNNDVVDITVVPSEASYKGENLLEALPAGMWFSYTDALLYNFRMTRYNVFVRISGEYKDEAELLEKLLEAYKNPLAYSRKRDPEYLLGRVNELTEALEKLQKASIAIANKGAFSSTLKPLDERAVKNVVRLKKENPKITVKEIQQSLEKDKTPLGEKEINLILGVFFNQFEK